MKFGQLDTWNEIDFSFSELPSLTKTVLAELPQVNQPNFYFGAPVFGDKNYKGTLFPQDTKQKDFIRDYGKQFNSIEVKANR